MPEEPRDLSLRHALEAAIGGDRLLVASDFDGTVAEIVSEPGLARGNQRAIDAMVRLARRRRVAVALITGRTRGDLIGLVGEPPGVLLIGEHGNDYGNLAGRGPDPRIVELLPELEIAAAGLPGSFLEVKVFAVGFHYRNSEPGQAASTVDRLKEWWEGLDRGVTLHDAKRILEFSVADRTKGTALLDLIAEHDATHAVFMGDDVTDEDAFEVMRLGDVDIKVGPAESIARYRLPDVSAVADTLEWIDEQLG